MPPEEEEILPLELNKSDSDLVMFFEPLEISTENLAEDTDIKLDKGEFIRGLKEASYACGMYTALINCGFTQEDSVAYLFNRMNVEHNIETTKITTNGNVEVSKNVAISKEKDML